MPNRIVAIFRVVDHDENLLIHFFEDFFLESFGSFDFYFIYKQSEISLLRVFFLSPKKSSGARERNQMDLRLVDEIE